MYNDRQNRGHQPPIANDHASGQLVYQDATDVSTVGSDIYASADTIRTGFSSAMYSTSLSTKIKKRFHILYVTAILVVLSISIAGIVISVQAMNNTFDNSNAISSIQEDVDIIKYTLGMAEPTVEPETSSASTGAVMTTGILNNNMSDGVRLAGSTEPDRGRIEVLYKEEWGTICDTYLDFNDARVICRMLGYEYAACVMGGSATANEFGSGTGRIWLSQVQCTGYEEDIGLCQHEGWGTVSCGHDEDTSVCCAN
ncbi:uncharacterized protein LOC120328652 [Styela clava]